MSDELSRALDLLAASSGIDGYLFICKRKGTDLAVRMNWKVGEAAEGVVAAMVRSPEFAEAVASALEYMPDIMERETAAGTMVLRDNIKGGDPS